ncbi:MAG: DUF2163 domain-containing protein [Hyphomonadaceae bacterium]
MKNISEDFAARLSSATTTLCDCWRFVRADGEVFGATDHDREIVLDGVTYQPARGLSGARFDYGAGLAPGQATVEGALDAAFLTESDLEAGVWDGARIDVWRVDWSAPENRIWIWGGRLSVVSRSGGAFAAELVSRKADLERTTGRVYSRACDARVGDARCGASPSAEGFRGAGAVASVIDARRLRLSGLGAFEAGWFSGGDLEWTSGANAGLKARIVRHRLAGGGEAEIELMVALPGAIAPGDAASLSAGCDGAFSTCRNKFANTVNFRGFPHMPGPDSVLAGPGAGGNDGGSRQ